MPMLPKLSNNTLRFGCVSKIQTIKAGVRLPASSRVPEHYQRPNACRHVCFGFGFQQSESASCVKTFRFLASLGERLNSLIDRYYDPIFMTDLKNMAVACMQFLFLYRSKNYGKMHI
jgi:hypothetical protein